MCHTESEFEDTTGDAKNLNEKMTAGFVWKQ